MTEPDDHIDPADRAWFQTQIAPIVDEPAVPEAWEAIAARVDGTPSPATSSHRHRRARVLAVAAVVLALVALGAVVVATRGGDDTQPLTTGSDGTGFYAPVGLPAGWNVTSATASRGGPLCAASGTEWIKPGSGSLSLTHDDCADTYQFEADAKHRVTTVLDDGITATGPSYEPDIEDTSGPLVLHWERDGAWTLRGIGLTDEEIIGVANASIADPGLTDLAVPGWQLLGEWSRPAREWAPTVAVNFEAPSGRTGSYELSLPGTWISEGGWQLLKPMEVDGQDQPFVKVVEPPERNGSSSWTSERYRGRWPGADVMVHRIVIEDQEADEITDQDLETLLTSLRPVTSEDWQSFLDTIPHVDKGLRTADTLGDVGSRGPQPTTTSIESGEPTTTSTSTTSTTTADDDPSTSQPVTDPPRTERPEVGPVTSGPGTVIDRKDEYGNFTDLDKLDIRLELESDRIHVGDVVGATLVMTNTTEDAIEFNECSRSLTQWGLVPASDPDRELPKIMIIDCYANEPNIPPGETVRFPVDMWGRDGFVAQEVRPMARNDIGGTLPGGDYLAVVQIPGKSNELRLSIPVTIPDPACPTSDADVAAFLRHSLEGAKDVAADRGDEIRLASVDGKRAALKADLRCDRINIDIRYGVVVNAVRY